MPPKLRTALRETLENVITMYIQSANEIKADRKRSRTKAREAK
jgi:hypothetical protein